ncbi:MAG: BamA/TamA family outer membrane protein, partial [Candidatus Binatia bacterium]
GELLANGTFFRQGESAELQAPDGRISFVVSREPFEVVERRIGRRVVRLYAVPSHELEHRISAMEPARAALLDTLPSILGESRASGDLTLVSLPLRWYPSAAAPKMVLLSDRLFEILVVLRPLHQRELAYAIFLEEELAAGARREPRDDAAWVAEGLAWRRAEDLYQKRFRSGREVKDWIGLFNFFAIVDRFETAPRIALRRPFFPVATSDDPLRIRLDSACGDRPPGRVLFDKLEARLRPEKFAALIDGYRKGTEPLRSSLRAVGGGAAEEFLAAWLRPYTPLNYALADVTLDPQGEFGARFRVEREAGERRPDSVELALETEHRTERFFLDLDAESTEVEKKTAQSVRSLTIDPDRRTIETRLDDDRVPPAHQVLLDSADVQVSSTEFGFSTLVVGRRRYDYRKDLAAAPFYTSRGYGIHAGFQLHGGKPIDASLYRQNLFAYYGIQQLDSSFRNEEQPGLRTRGRLGGFGFRFNSYDAFWFENPARSRHLRVFFDAYDRALGSSFDFVQTGASLTLTLPLRDDTVIAGQVMNGFSVTTGRDTIPNQGLFSLGGFRSIRGIGAEDDLGKNIFIVRAELRHLLPFRFNGNFQELLIARRLQVKAFVDAGRVENTTRRLYDPSGFAVGVGAGLNLFYEFMGFFPTTFYLDFATRADEAGDLQVLFGAKQPF